MDSTYIRNDKTRISLLASRVRLCGTLILVGSIFAGFLLFVSTILPSLDNTGYIRTKCNTTHFIVRTNQHFRQKCNCLPDDGTSKCTIYYPCLQLTAAYNLKGKTQQGLVVKCRRHVGDKCSFIVQDYDCISEKSVYGQLKEFRDEYTTTKRTFSCYVNSNKPNYVVLKGNKLNKQQIINVVLWPCLGLTIGLVLMLSSKVLTSFYCGNYYRRTYNDEDTEPLTGTADS